MSAVDEADRSHRARLVLPGTAQARAWNEKLRAVVRADTSEVLPFFCECGIDDCQSLAWLAMQQARGLVESGGTIIGTHVPEELEVRLSRRG